MKIAVTSQGTNLDAFVDPRFGRCQYFLIIDTDALTVDAAANDSRSAASGAGIQAAQFIAEKGVKALITGSVGPNADAVLKSAGIAVYRGAGTVGSVVEKFKAGKLPAMESTSPRGSATE